MNEKIIKDIHSSIKNLEKILDSKNHLQRNVNSDEFPLVAHALKSIGSWPISEDYTNYRVDYSPIKNFLVESGFNLVYESNILSYEKKMLPRLKIFEKNKVFVQLEYYSKRDELIEILTGEKEEKIEGSSNVIVLYPPKTSSFYDEALHMSLREKIIELIIPPKEDLPSIDMICHEQGDFYLREFYLDKEYTLIDPDLHYGEGFTDFNQKLLKAIDERSKGLVLFHGTPGTGKTYYIRHLISQLLKIKKNIIYFPPSMVDMMTSPEILDFLANEIEDMKMKGKKCVILLEDAEPLLESRKNGGRTSGITNLLNLTDGLLNDMLSIQVIATFNTDLKNIDEALLRPERLIARKEFSSLDSDQSFKLAEKLNVVLTEKRDYTLAEIYSKMTENEPIIHGTKVEKKLGF
jgi:hypothetical protein